MIILEGTLATLIMMIIAIAMILLGFQLAERGTIKPNVRKIHGLTSIEDAISRCKEMGRPILYCGIGVIQAPDAIASLNILGFVAQQAATLDIPINVALQSSNIYTSTVGVLENAARAAGRPEAYNPNSAKWWSDNWTTYFFGMIELADTIKPAAFFEFGQFWDENVFIPVWLSAHGIDCFCMAGTRQLQVQPTTLMGTDDWFLSEELFAAAAYVSGTKEAQGGVMMSDWLKIITLALIVIGAVAYLAGSTIITDLLVM